MTYITFSIGMKTKGKTLDLHRLWRQIAVLKPDDANKVLSGIVDKKFTIREAIQVIFIYL